jgi:citrate synthase
VHGKLPNCAELAGYKAKLKSLRGIPASVKAVLEQLPPSAHPMDVMRTGVSVHWAARCRKRTTTTIRVRAILPTS